MPAVGQAFLCAPSPLLVDYGGSPNRRFRRKCVVRRPHPLDHGSRGADMHGSAAVESQTARGRGRRSEPISVTRSALQLEGLTGEFLGAEVGNQFIEHGGAVRYEEILSE